MREKLDKLLSMNRNSGLFGDPGCDYLGVVDWLTWSVKSKVRRAAQCSLNKQVIIRIA